MLSNLCIANGNAIDNSGITINKNIKVSKVNTASKRQAKGIIVKWKGNKVRALSKEALSNDIGAEITSSKSGPLGTNVIEFNQFRSVVDLEQMINDLRARDDVEFAELNEVVGLDIETGHPDDPNSPDYDVQNYFSEPSEYLPYAINLPAAQKISQGEGVTVAVVDTGYVPHVFLQDKFLPGYDFISDPESARDGDGPDADASDEGTWGSAEECQGEFDVISSWHGTEVSSVISASSIKEYEFLNVAPKAKILPVRVLGKCNSGTIVDIVNGMLWAAGIDDTNIPKNPNPASVINMSIQSEQACKADSLYQKAVNKIKTKGIIVVAIAGNYGQRKPVSPGHCDGVMSVGATGLSANKTGYSSHGEWVDLSAPGGEIKVSNIPNDPNEPPEAVVGGIHTLSNYGFTTPEPYCADPELAPYGFAEGTSFAAPMVSGVAALMISAYKKNHPDKSLDPDTIESVLKSTNRPFPAYSDCRYLYQCGAGILDAKAAVEEVNNMGRP